MGIVLWSCGVSSCLIIGCTRRGIRDHLKGHVIRTEDSKDGSTLDGDGSVGGEEGLEANGAVHPEGSGEGGILSRDRCNIVVEGGAHKNKEMNFICNPKQELDVYINNADACALVVALDGCPKSSIASKDVLQHGYMGQI